MQALRICELDTAENRATAAELAIRLAAKEFSASELGVAAETIGRMLGEMDATAMRKHFRNHLDRLAAIHERMLSALRTPDHGDHPKHAEPDLRMPKAFRAALAEFGEEIETERGLVRE